MSELSGCAIMLGDGASSIALAALVEGDEHADPGEPERRDAFPGGWFG